MVSRTLLSAQHSTTEFLSASSIFSLALLVAAIHSTTRSEFDSGTAVVLTQIIPINSVLPTVILNVSSSTMLRRSKRRVVLWLVIDALVIALTIQGGFGLAKKTMDLYGESPCVDSSLKNIFRFSVIVGGCLAFGITAHVVDSIVSMLRHRPGVIVRLPSKMQWGVIGASTCIMWVFIGWFINLTNTIRSRAGEDNNDNKWTFGQVLALATWLPVIVEFTYIWWESPVQAMNGRLMAPYEVVATPIQESLLEIKPSSGDEESGRFQRLE
jgi:hypothetical protein